MRRRKTAPQLQDEKKQEAARNAWAQDLHQRGFDIRDRREYDALLDIVNLLALAARRFPSPFDYKDLQAQVRALYFIAQAQLDKTVCWRDFQPDEQGPTDDKIIYLPKPNP